MKDYTKYDFAAIVGAEVRIKYDNNDDPYNGIVLGLYGEGQLSKPIILLETSSLWYVKGEVITQNPCNIISLTAKIKVEDMSVKQLRRLLEPYKKPYEKHGFIIDEDGVHHVNLYLCDSLDDVEPMKLFTDYIDCTEWGWKE